MAQEAIAEGRRIYLGNLQYSIQPQDVEQMLKDNGFDSYDKIHIAIDPVSARNPGYCFVDFFDREDANRALSSLDASINGRHLKIGPCDPKRNQGGRGRQVHEPTFQRWGDYDGARSSGDVGVRINDSTPSAESQQGPYRAQEHHADINTPQAEGRRLYVGGLDKMIDQAHNDEEMRELFAGFNVTAIGKRITPHENTRSLPGKHHYCFVDFESAQEAENAADQLNGQVWQGDQLKVRIAYARSERPRNRPAALEREQEQPGKRPRPTPEERMVRQERQESIRNMSSWR